MNSRVFLFSCCLPKEIYFSVHRPGNCNHHPPVPSTMKFTDAKDDTHRQSRLRTASSCHPARQMRLGVVGRRMKLVFVARAFPPSPLSRFSRHNPLRLCYSGTGKRGKYRSSLLMSFIFVHRRLLTGVRCRSNAQFVANNC